MMKKQPCVPGGNPHPASPGAPFKRSLLVGACHLSPHLNKTETSQAIPNQTVPSQAVASPNLPSPHSLPRWGKTNPSSKTKSSKPTHPPIPPHRNHAPGRHLRPGLPTAGGRKHQRISGESLTARKAPQARPRCFFRPLFSEKSGHSPPAPCGQGKSPPGLVQSRKS